MIHLKTAASLSKKFNRALDCKNNFYLELRMHMMWLLELDIYVVVGSLEDRKLLAAFIGGLMEQPPPFEIYFCLNYKTTLAQTLNVHSVHYLRC